MIDRLLTMLQRTTVSTDHSGVDDNDILLATWKEKLDLEHSKGYGTMLRE